MNIVCCNECFASIARLDTKAARLWMDLCVYFSHYGVMELKEWVIPDAIETFSRLETLGFVTTADGLNAIKIKLNGYLKVSLENMEIQTYCIDREGHGHEWK